MEEISQIALFGLFLIKALVYAVAGGAIMGFLDVLEHLWLDGRVTKRQYLWALALSFLLGTFIQWRDMHNEMKQLRNRAEDVANMAASSLSALRNQLDEKQRQIAALEKKFDEKTKRKAIREQLAKFLAEGEQLKRAVFRDVKAPPPLAKVDNWGERVSQYLEREMGRADMVQFVNPPRRKRNGKRNGVRHEY